MRDNIDMKEEFCLNSRRWICLMIRPPNACPLKEEQLMKCETCSYCVMREPSEYLLDKVRKFQEFFKKRMYDELERKIDEISNSK